MPLWPRWNTMPPQGTPIDDTHPLASDFILFAPINESSGTVANDIVGDNAMTLLGGTTWAPVGSPWGGYGLACTTAGLGAQTGAWPVPLQTASGPYSVVCGFVWNGTSNGFYANLFGLCSSSANNSTSQPCALQWQTGGPHIGAYFNGKSVYTSTSIAANVPYVAVCTVSGVTPNGTCSVWMFPAWPGTGNAILSATSTGMGAATVWGSGACVFAGTMPGATTLNPQVTILFGGLLNRLLTFGQASALAANIWQIMQPDPYFRLLAHDAAPASTLFRRTLTNRTGSRGAA